MINAVNHDDSSFLNPFDETSSSLAPSKGFETFILISPFEGPLPSHKVDMICISYREYLSIFEFIKMI